MKTKTLVCTLLVLLIAFADAQAPNDLRPDRSVAGRMLPPQLRARDELMLRMHDRTTGSLLGTNANTQPYKVNPLIQWQQSLGGTNNESAYSIQQTKDGGYIVAGYSTSNDGDVSGNHGYYDCWIVKLSSTGAIQWQKSLGGSGFDAANSIQQTIEGGYIIAGSSDSNDGDVTGNRGESDYWIVKLGRNGNLQVEESFGGSNLEDGYSGCITKDYGYVVAGWSISNDRDVSGNHGNLDYWIVKLKGLKSLLPAADDATFASMQMALAKDADKPLLHIQPNPSPNGLFTIDMGSVRNKVLLSVTNSSGRQVYAKQLAAAQQITISLNNQPKGIYYLQISYDGGKQVEKLVVQ